MSDVLHTIDVNVPIAAAYDQWTRFEDFPEFMSGVLSVERTGDHRTHWVTTVGGAGREFDALVTEQRPEELIAWTSAAGDLLHTGVVSFQRLGDFETRVTVRIVWEPAGLVERAASALGLDDLQVKVDLDRFKAYIEDSRVVADEPAADEPTLGARIGSLITGRTDPEAVTVPLPRQA